MSGDDDASVLDHDGPVLASDGQVAKTGKMMVKDDAVVDESPVRNARRRWRIVGISSLVLILGILCVVLLALFLGGRIIHADIDLGYTRYRGVLHEDSAVKAWLGMRYAAAPVGDLRFAAPQDPVKIDGIQSATKHGKTCLAVNDRVPVRRDTDEDCLFIDVYAPAEATSESKFPVFFFIQGGGFAGNSNANYNGAGLIQAADMELVVVTFNYRVGPYGFLSGDAVDSLNNGLKDQRKALQWVKHHISKFGGNPDHVVLVGASAGAASVAIHLAAYGGSETDLFHAAAMGSPSFGTVLHNVETQFQYEAFVNATSCQGASDTLTCLRGLSSDEIQQANRFFPYPGFSTPPVFSWNPVIDGDMIQDYPYNTFNRGDFLKVPTIVGDDANGGTIFVPRNMNSLNQSNDFLRNTFPYLNQTHIDTLNELYPVNTSLVFPNAGPYWRRTANVYGEIRYMCPSIFLSTAISTHGKNKNVSSWNYFYNVQDPRQVSSGLGVPHTVELAAIWGPDNMGGDPIPDSYRSGKSNADIVPMIQGYWTSFVRSFNPNKHRQKGTSEWKAWTGELTTDTQSNGVLVQKTNRDEQMLFDTPVKSTRMDSVDEGLWERCQYLWSIGPDIRQ